MKNSDSLKDPVTVSGSRKNTFVVRVEHRQRGTWQGKVIWAEGNRTVCFRSALELFRLMKEVLAEKAESREYLKNGTEC